MRKHDGRFGMGTAFLGVFVISMLLGHGRPSTAKDGKAVDLLATAIEPSPCINDMALHRTFEQRLVEQFNDGKTVAMAALRRQLVRNHILVKLPKATMAEMTLPEVYCQCKNSVLVVGYLYMCEKCGKRHLSPATGFVLTRSGVIATAYHVVDRPNSEAIGAMTSDGTVYCVTKVIAASRIDDIAVLQLDGSGFQPLTLSVDAPVGTSVAMIGHPSRQFYMLTTGIISRYYTHSRAGIETRWMSATAEIGGGASGGPLLSYSGAVTGMAVTTRPVFAAAHGNEPKRVQMVINQFVPARVIRDLLSSTTGFEADPPSAPRDLISRIERMVKDEAWDAIEIEASAWITDHPDELATLIYMTGRLIASPDPGCKPLAERILRKVLEADPNAIDALRTLAHMYHSREDNAKELAINRQILAIDPDNVFAMNSVAWILTQEMGQHREALVLAARALERAPEYTNLLDTHGVICRRLKRYDDAEVSLRKVIRVCQQRGTETPTLVTSHYHLAEVYWATGRKEEAGLEHQNSLQLHSKVGGLSPEQRSLAKQRCEELSIPFERPADP